jgi:serine/threonine-protein kinase
MLPEALAPGRTLAGRYRLERRLGTGGMASVWLARDGVLGRRVAAKVISEELAYKPSWQERFQREARAVAALSHPNVVRVFDLGRDDGRWFIVMQYLARGSLAERLARAPARSGRAPAARPAHSAVTSSRRLEPLRIAAGLLAGVGHIHEAGLMHRDIKPGNILIGDDGSALLTDFGIALLPDVAQLTDTGDVLGTARYMAPELLRGAPASVASDLFACGRVIDDLHGRLGGERALAGLAAEMTTADPASRPRSARAAIRLLEEEQAMRADQPPSTVAHEPAHARPTPAGRGAHASIERTDRLPPRGQRAREITTARLADVRAAAEGLGTAGREAGHAASERATMAGRAAARSAGAGLAHARVTAVQGAGTAAHRTRAGSRRAAAATTRHFSPASLATLLALAALVAVVLVIAAGENARTVTHRFPGPAPPHSSLHAQLEALRREVGAAARR